MEGTAATTTVSLFSKTPLLLSGQAPDATPLVTGNGATGKWDSWMQVALLMGCAILSHLQELDEIVSLSLTEWKVTPAYTKLSMEAIVEIRLTMVCFL
eukprot:6781364-Ditylum_brightwellii.AAC.1